MDSTVGKQAVKEFFIQIRKSFSETVSLNLLFCGTINGELAPSEVSCRAGTGKLATYKVHDCSATNFQHLKWFFLIKENIMLVALTS